MFRIRRIHDDTLPVNKQAIADVQVMFGSQFAQARPEEIELLPERLRNPFRQRFRTILSVAENGRGSLQGFALLLHDPELNFCLLDYLASSRRLSGRGIGGALYEHVRDEALASGAKGLFFECLPDEPDRCPDETLRKQNAARLRFYERYGARPVVGTRYEEPINPGERGMPHLVYDDLDTGRPLRREFARHVVRAILERKYAHLCPPDYVQRVVASFRDDPLGLREPRYHRQPPPRRLAQPRGLDRVALVVADQHEIHHIRERGYVEAPVRIRAILHQLEPTGWFDRLPPREFPEDHIRAVHDDEFVDYLRVACAAMPAHKSLYPYVFPVRNASRAPKEVSVRAGYYCIDTFTPLNQNAFPAAKRAVDCTLTAADELLAGRRLAYALVRPPGHHAESRLFGGFCYFNNAAIAAQYLSHVARVAILDIDYHHGNGQQEIFYQRNDVFTVSIHGDPDFAYPYFTGFADERGSGAGEGYNLNLPLPETQDGPQYRLALEQALEAITDFVPGFLIVALGLDPAKGDPTGTWSLGPRDFQANGRLLAGLGLPMLVVQEGGYRTRTLGVNARYFFRGLAGIERR